MVHETAFKMANWSTFVSQVKALPIVKQRAVSAIVGAVVADAAGKNYDTSSKSHLTKLAIQQSELVD